MKDRAFYELDENDPDIARVLTRTAEALISDQAGIRNRWRQSAALYLYGRSTETCSPPVVTARGISDGLMDLSGIDAIEAGAEELASWNICRAMTDAIVSRVTLHQALPQYMTDDGSEDDQITARTCDRYIRDAFARCHADQVSRRALRLAAIFGLCGIRVLPSEQEGRPVLRVLPPDRIIVDARVVDTDPMTMMIVDIYDRATAAAMWAPGEEHKLDGSLVSWDDAGIHGYVVITEGFQRASHNAEGRHVVACGDVLLRDEPWPFQRHPVVVSRYRPPMVGFHGSGLGDSVLPIQEEINAVNADIAANRRMLGQAYISVRRSDGIDLKDLASNARWRVIETNGEPAQVILPPSMPADQFAYLDRLWQKAYELEGVSQLAATAAKPPGLDSGEALRVYHDIQTQRFSELENQHAEMRVALGEAILDAARILQDADALAEGTLPPLPVDRLSITLRAAPASSLPHDPAGRRAELEARIRSGLIDREAAVRQLGWSDLSKDTELVSAPHDLLEMIFEDLLAGRDVMPPSTMMDLPRAVRLGMQFWNRAARYEASDEALARVEDWTHQAAALLQPAQPPAPTVSPDLPAGPEAAAQLAAAQGALAPPPAGMPQA